VVLNRVYLYLVTGRDGEDREKFDTELWAPLEGWAAAEADAWRRLDELAVDGDG